VPFEPARFPFFYGWLVLGAGTIGMLMSAPGQTVGVSVFTDSLIGALDLSRSLLSLGYLVGTLGSAFLLARAGRLYDRYGARTVGTLAGIGLAVTLVLLSVSDRLAGTLVDLLRFLPAQLVAFSLISVLFFFLRFTGQGMLTLASRNMVMEWFESRRGIANAIMGMSLSFGFSYAPRVFEPLVGGSGWQTAWRIIAMVVGGFAIFAAVFYRDTPEAHGLKPDGGDVKVKRDPHPESVADEPFTLREARRTYSFWVFALALTIGSLLVTAYTFHVVSIFDDAGMPRSRAVSIFFPASIVAVAIQSAGSWLSDRLKLKYFCSAQLLGIMVVAFGLVVLSPGWPVPVLIVGHGMMQGIFGITSNITWPRFFGRRHLGAISGFAASLTVAGSALGPYLFSFGRDLTGGYAVPAAICGAVAATLFVGSFWADRPAHPSKTALPGTTP
jgi:sugar phosphate permease